MSRQTQIPISGSISIAEHPIGPTGAAHSYIIFDIGDEIVEMHGFPTNRLSNAITDGLPWDFNDSIRYWDTHSLCVA